MTGSLVDRVRTSCARVTEQATLVQLDHQAIATYDPGLVRGHIPDDPLFEDGSEQHENPDRSEEQALLIFALDAINFGSGYHDIIRKLPGCSGAVTMARSLKEFAQTTGPLRPERLRAITPHDCSAIFGQELDGGELEELMVAFSIGLNDLGTFIDEHGGTARALIELAAGSAVSLAELLTTMPFYRDVERLDGDAVHFYKRAQITAADLGRQGNLFTDLHHLTAFADNLVPHVLRVDGILRYDLELATSIDNGERLEAGSRAEIEIRAGGVHAVELLATRLGRRPMDIDAALWHRGAQPRYKAIPRHRACSVFY